MSDPTMALQIALDARLTEKLTVPVFDSVPECTPLPYVTLDYEVASNTTPIYGKQRENRLFYLSVWSDFHGQMEVKRIMAEIYEALNEKPLQLDEGHVVSVRVIRTQTIREPDNRTFMGAVTLRIITQH